MQTFFSVTSAELGSLAFSIWLFLPYISIFVFGAFMGSFLNVVADRTAQGRDFVKGHSSCDFCNAILKASDLVPVLSFVSTGGKCRYCKEKLSIAYPLSELLTASFFVLALSLSNYAITYSFRNFMDLVYLLVVFSFYLVIFLADFKYQLIPTKIVIPAIGFVFFGSLGFRVWDFLEIRNFVRDFSGISTIPLQVEAGQLLKNLASSWGLNVVSALLLSGFFLFLYKVTKGKGMGFGDVRLALLIGLFHPFPVNVVAIFGSFVFGAFFSVFLLVFGRAGMKSKVAFGPFMVLSSVVSLVYGSAIVRWYFSRWLGF